LAFRQHHHVLCTKLFEIIELIVCAALCAHGDVCVDAPESRDGTFHLWVFIERGRGAEFSATVATVEGEVVDEKQKLRKIVRLHECKTIESDQAAYNGSQGSLVLPLEGSHASSTEDGLDAVLFIRHGQLALMLIDLNYLETLR
jgi:hypothetical protein